MKKSINLVIQGKKSSSKIYRKLYLLSFGLFILVIAVGFGLLMLRLAQRGIYDSLDKQDQELVSSLLSFQVKKDKLLEIKSRLSSIDMVIQKRAPTTARLITMTNLVPLKSTVISLAGTKEVMTVSLQSESLSDLDELLEKKIAELTKDKTKIIKTVEMKSFSLDPGSLTYSITLEISFG